MRLKLGVFSYTNALRNGPEVNPKVRVALEVELECGLNWGFYDTFRYEFHRCKLAFLNLVQAAVAALIE